jgi:peptidoglycan/xylan/chitin deacetylase (PgdA/CDA1 family)
MPVAYLTIDDAPSDDFTHKLAFLRARGVPAVFFCIGERLERHEGAVMHAIRDGFLIGNHSYSHPRFSELSVDAATREITLTDAIIERLYRAAGRQLPAKLFRFPYGDKGRDIRLLNRRLTALGYAGLRIADPRLTFPFLRWLRFRDADSWWTFDVLDWCLAHADHQYRIHSPQDVFDRLDRELSRTWWTIGSNHVFLLHDHTATADVFEHTIELLLARGFVFKLPSHGHIPTTELS